MLTSLLALPIQVNLSAWNCARLGAEQRIERGAAADGGDARCRPWRRRCRASWRAAGCRRLPCSSARWSGLPGNVLAEVARDHARIEIVGAADAVADVELDVACPCRMPPGLRVRGESDASTVDGRDAEHRSMAQAPRRRASRMREHLGSTRFTSDVMHPGRLLRRVAHCASSLAHATDDRSEPRRVLDLVEPVEAHLLDDAVAHHDQPRLLGRRNAGGW